MPAALGLGRLAGGGDVVARVGVEAGGGAGGAGVGVVGARRASRLRRTGRWRRRSGPRRRPRTGRWRAGRRPPVEQARVGVGRRTGRWPGRCRPRRDWPVDPDVVARVGVEAGGLAGGFLVVGAQAAGRRSGR